MTSGPGKWGTNKKGAQVHYFILRTDPNLPQLKRKLEEAVKALQEDPENEEKDEKVVELEDAVMKAEDHLESLCGRMTRYDEKLNAVLGMDHWDPCDARTCKTCLSMRRWLKRFPP